MIVIGLSVTDAKKWSSGSESDETVHILAEKEDEAIPRINPISDSMKCLEVSHFRTIALPMPAIMQLGRGHPSSSPGHHMTLLDSIPGMLPPNTPRPPVLAIRATLLQLTVSRHLPTAIRQAQQPQPGHRRSLEEGPPPPSVAYNPAHGPLYDSPRRPGEEGHASQRNLLAIQEINRKGRISPLPQAVQGAQPQISGPGGEPGIKSEFGRMFSGIGSGVSGIVSSPIAPGAQLAYTNASLARRDDADGPAQDSGPEAAGKAPAKGKRRKLKDAPDVKGDEESTGRLTPAGRTKRAKTHQHHHQQLQRQPSDVGYSSTPAPLPWLLIKDKENCTLTIKVSRAHLTKGAREEITYRRALWGTDVYTDDTDVVAACIHGGWIRGEWSNVDANMLDLDRGVLLQDKEPIPNKRRKDKERDEQARQEANMATYLDKAPNTGPVQVQADRDLQVTILILPRLEKYSSTVRFGVKSREWGGTYGGRKSVHDGISYMITAIRWVDNGAGAQSRLRGKGRRERMRKAMAEVKSIDWPESNGDQVATTVAAVDMTGAWRKTAEVKRANGETEVGDKSEKAPSEGDKENQPADKLERHGEQSVEDGAAAAEKQEEKSEAGVNGEKSS
ncbi:hypothetical protein ACHAQA_000152 [Verticillium albo-atrum]